MSESAHKLVPGELADARERYLGLYERERRGLPGGNAEFVHSLRERGLARFGERGLPTLRDDDWKYTNVAPIAKVPFALAPAPAGPAPESALYPGAAGVRLVFVNGRFDAASSRLDSSGSGIRVASLREVLAREPDVVAGVLGEIAGTGAHGFAALNTALFSDGAVIVAEAGARMDAPIHLVYVGAAETPGAAMLRNVVVAGAGSSIALVEHYVSAEGGPWLTNALTEVAVGEGAQVTHYKIQEEGRGSFHLSSTEARVGRDGRLASYLIAVGGRLARTETRVRLVAAGAACKLDGLYLPRGEQLLDAFTFVEHAAPHGASQQLYKGILDDGARGVWTGRVLVAKQAQKTSALQTNRNLLLSERAHVDTRPQLEIYADDVKCSHGATVGRLDADALFYLRARGIDEGAARRLLTYAFASEVVSAMPSAEVRSPIEHALGAGLLAKGEPA